MAEWFPHCDPGGSSGERATTRTRPAARKATVSVVKYVRQSARKKQRDSNWKNFRKITYVGRLQNYVDFLFWLKQDTK